MCNRDNSKDAVRISIKFFSISGFHDKENVIIVWLGTV